MTAGDLITAKAYLDSLVAKCLEIAGKHKVKTSG
jgi:hypothetical protein